MTLTPSSASRLEELASRVEAASGPDRELDVAIADVMTAQAGWPEPFSDVCVPMFTASIDAAMSLVPESARGGRWFNLKAGRETVSCEVRVYDDGIEFKHALGEASMCATPALALTAAALRALAQGGPHA